MKRMLGFHPNPTEQKEKEVNHTGGDGMSEGDGETKKGEEKTEKRKGARS